jgi:signal transduction histidine kinase
LDAQALALAGRRRQMGGGSAALDGAGSWWRSGLRSFVIVGLSAVVPLVLLSLVFGYRASTQQRQAAELEASMRIDGAAHRLDSLLAAQSAAVLGVAGFRSVGLGDYPHLYEHLQLMPGRHPEWANIILADESGERIMDLRSPYGRLLPPLDLSGLPSSSPTGTVVIGGIAPPGAFAKGRSIPLYAPTLGKDGRRLVVVIALDPVLMETVLEETGLPGDWRGAVLDADGVVVARSDNSPLAVGEKAKDARRLLSEGRTFSLASPIRQAQWTMLCEIPTELLDRQVNAAWWLMLVLGGGALGLAVLLASLVARDMAERRQMELQRAEQRLQASEAWRLLALDAADIGTWHWDAVSGTLQGCDRCRQLFELSGPSLALRPLLALFFPGEARAVIGAALASYRAGQPFEREFRIRLGGGGQRWVQLYGRPLFDDRGRPIGTYGVLIDIDEQKRAEAEHRLLLGRLHSAQEEERLRISRELHDRVGQSVTGLSLAVKKLEATRGGNFEDIKRMILEISRDVHRAAVELRPTALDDFGLLGAIETYLREWQQRTGLAAETFVTGLSGVRLPALVETTAYRIIVELLTNIARHAEASTVSLTLTVRTGLLMLIVEDNGRGMSEPAPPGHLGLLGIRERLELIGGEMKIETAPSEGTAVFVRIPLPAALMKGEAA